MSILCLISVDIWYALSAGPGGKFSCSKNERLGLPSVAWVNSLNFRFLELALDFGPSVRMFKIRSRRVCLAIPFANCPLWTLG